MTQRSNVNENKVKKVRRTRWEPMKISAKPKIEDDNPEKTKKMISEYKKNSEQFRQLSSFIDDKKVLAEEILSIVDRKTRNEIFPELEKMTSSERHKVIYNLLKGISKNRVCSILNGRDISSSSATETEYDSSVSSSGVIDDLDDISEKIDSPGQGAPKKIGRTDQSSNFQSLTSRLVVEKRPDDELEDGEIFDSSPDLDERKQNYIAYDEKIIQLPSSSSVDRKITDSSMMSPNNSQETIKRIKQATEFVCILPSVSSDDELEFEEFSNSFTGLEDGEVEPEEIKNSIDQQRDNPVKGIVCCEKCIIGTSKTLPMNISACTHDNSLNILTRDREDTEKGIGAIQTAAADSTTQFDEIEDYDYPDFELLE